MHTKTQMLKDHYPLLPVPRLTLSISNMKVILLKNKLTNKLRQNITLAEVMNNDNHLFKTRHYLTRCHYWI